MNIGRPLYEHNPNRGQELATSLDALADSLGVGQMIDGREYAATRDPWLIKLEVKAGKLCVVSATRAGQETYEFKRPDDGAWHAVGRQRRFEAAHFHNVVVLATLEGLEWTASQEQLAA